MRRKDKSLSNDVAIEVLKNAEYGILCFASKDGGYGIPMVYAYDDGKIWIHGSSVGRKNDDMKYDDRVCFTVVDDVQMDTGKYVTKNRSVMVFGRIRQVEEPERQEGLEAYRMKKGLEPRTEEQVQEAMNKKRKATFFCIDIEQISAKGRTLY